MENLEKKRIRFEFMVDDKWKWYAQDKDGTITLFVDKPNFSLDDKAKDDKAKGEAGKEEKKPKVESKV